MASAFRQIPLRLGLVFLAYAAPAWAYEVDNFTDRGVPLADARPAINAEMDRLIAKAIAFANAQLAREGKNCSSARLPDKQPPIYDALEGLLCGGVVGTLEDWATREKAVPKRPVSKADIYSAQSLLQTASKILHGPVLSAYGLEPSLRLGTVYCGVDKLGHFLDQGKSYFDRFQTRRLSFQEVTAFGVGQEDGIFGLTSTGVKSWGDISANYSGLLFWRDIFYGARPMIACTEGQYVRQRPFDIGEYASDAWDEGVNCSQFSDSIGAIVKENLRRMAMSCPVDQQKCRNLLLRGCASYFVGPACQALGKASSTCDLEKPGLPRIGETKGSCSGCSSQGARPAEEKRK